MTDEIHQVWQRVSDIEQTAWSPDGRVTVTVDALGGLRSLRLDPRIYRDDTAELLAATIIDTAREAADEAHRRAFETVKPLLDKHATVADADLALDPILHLLRTD